MNWGPLVEQSALAGFLQILALVFVIGVLAGIALLLLSRRNRR